MKKSLTALALGAALLSGSALAANVEVYGLIDTSLAYVYTDADHRDRDSDGEFKLNTGREFGSRVGLRGTEDLGNGTKIGFVLESGFASDTGALEQNGRLFGREAHIDLRGDWGYVSFGLQTLFGSVLGENGLFRAISPLFTNYTEGFGFADGFPQYARRQCGELPHAHLGRFHGLRHVFVPKRLEGDLPRRCSNR